MALLALIDLDTADVLVRLRQMSGMGVVDFVHMSGDWWARFSVASREPA